MAKKATPKECDFFFDRTLVYEVGMMRESYRLLVQARLAQLRKLLPRSDVDVLRNALIESFCIHARNLIEFFKNKDACDFDPRWFTTEGYQLERRFVGDSVLTRINEQIAHISRDRITYDSNKIDDTERERISTAIEGELARFRQHLSTEYQPPRWNIPARPNYGTVPVSEVTTTATPPQMIGTTVTPLVSTLKFSEPGDGAT